MNTSPASGVRLAKNRNKYTNAFAIYGTDKEVSYSDIDSGCADALYYKYECNAFSGTINVPGDIVQIILMTQAKDNFTATITATVPKTTLLDTNVVTYEDGNAINGTYAEAEKDGYLFMGWYTDAACTPGNEFDPETDVEELTKDITVYAKWEEATGLFDADGNQLVSWDTLVNDYGLIVEQDRTSITAQSKTALGRIIRDNEDWAVNATKIIIPDSVTKIGNQGLGTNSSDNSIQEVVIGSGVTSIGSMTFHSFDYISSINVDENNSSYSSIDGVLYDKTVSTLVAYPTGNSKTEYVIPDSVNTIGMYALSRCHNLNSVVIGSGVNLIGLRAFDSSHGLTEIVIPDNVTLIERFAFEDCSNLSSVEFKDPNNWYADGSLIPSSDLANKTTAASFLRTTYCSDDWEKK